MTSTTSVSDALASAMKRMPRYPVEADPEWPSPCTPPGAEGMVTWKAVRQTEPWNVSELEAALGAPLHPSIKGLFGSWWGCMSQAIVADEVVDLAVPWNRMSLERTTQALLTEIRFKVESGWAPTVFVGNTDSDVMWVVDNRDGSVWLEEVGYPPDRRVDDSLVGLIERLWS